MTITLHLPENAAPALATFLSRARSTDTVHERQALRQFIQVNHRLDAAGAKVIETTAENLIFALRAKRSREMRMV